MMYSKQGGTYNAQIYLICATFSVTIDLLHNNPFYSNYDFSAANNSSLVNEYHIFTSSRFVVFARKIIISLRKIIVQEVL